jgi:hypothetical protein
MFMPAWSHGGAPTPIRCFSHRISGQEFLAPSKTACRNPGFQPPFATVRIRTAAPSFVMPEPLPQAAAEAADISAISQLILTERECRDLGRWNRMRSCFHPDSRVRLSWFDGRGPDFVEGSIDMARRGMLAKHRLGPPQVRVNGNRAVVSMSAIIDIPDVIGGVEVQLSSHARFLFRTERRDATWRISFFDCYYLRDELTTAIPGVKVPVSFDDLKPFRKSLSRPLLSAHAEGLCAEQRSCRRRQTGNGRRPDDRGVRMGPTGSRRNLLGGAAYANSMITASTARLSPFFA